MKNASNRSTWFSLSNKYCRLMVVGLVLGTSAFFFQNCSPVAFSEQHLASQLPEGIEGGLCAGPGCESVAPLACLFNGEALTDGSVVTAFLNSTVSYGTECVSERRTCRDGNLSGSYNYANCSVGAAASCLFNGQTFEDGQTVRAYQNSSVASNAQCVEEVRKCENGVLSGSYSFGTCSVAAAASCLFNNQTIASGQTVNAFQTSSVPQGSSCVGQVRKCENGVLSGSYSFGTCSVAAAASCLFNNQTIASGQTVNAFQASSVPYGSSCIGQVRTCNNGALNGSYNYSTCSVAAAASCLFNGQTLAHGQNVTAFQSSSVPYGNSCVSEVRTCNNGVLTGSATYLSCTPQVGEETVEVITGAAYCVEYQTGNDNSWGWGCGGNNGEESTWNILGSALKSGGCASGHEKRNVLYGSGAEIGFTCHKTVAKSAASSYSLVGAAYCNPSHTGTQGCGGSSGSTWKYVGKAQSGGCAQGQKSYSISDSGGAVGFVCINGAAPTVVQSAKQPQALEKITGVAYCAEVAGTAPQFYCDRWNYFGTAQSGERCSDGAQPGDKVASLSSGGTIGFSCKKTLFTLPSSGRYLGAAYCAERPNTACGGAGSGEASTWKTIGAATASGGYCTAGSATNPIQGRHGTIGYTCTRP